MAFLDFSGAAARLLNFCLVYTLAVRARKKAQVVTMPPSR